MTPDSLIQYSEELNSLSIVDPMRFADETPHLHRDALKAIAAGVEDPQVFAKRILGLPLDDEASIRQ